MFLQTTVQSEEFCKALCTQIHSVVSLAASCRQTQYSIKSYLFSFPYDFCATFAWSISTVWSPRSFR